MFYTGLIRLEHITCLQAHSICQESRFTLPLGTILIQEFLMNYYLLYVGDVVEVCILDRKVVGTYLVSEQIVW
jgi:hypothetical protein